MSKQDTVELLPQERSALAKLKTNFPHFAANCLKVKSKSGDVIPFKLNRVQLYLHDKLEDQLKRNGKIRAIVVKGRQMGISTYVESRYYWTCWGTPKSLNAFILTHKDSATNALFDLAKGFHTNHVAFATKNAGPVGAHPLAASNAKELRFATNDCSYSIATAGSTEVGRGSTFHLYHGSEVAFWPNADNHVAASAQALSAAPGTAMILESTAEGVGNLFYRYAMAAMRGESDFELIFLPWFWHDEYELKCPDNWSPSEQWMEYGRHLKLTWEQLYWAYIKNRDLANSINASIDEPCWKFKQEYPSNVTEAFQTSGQSFIDAPLVQRARKPDTKVIPHGPVILGIDPARNRDKIGVIDRQGRVMGSRVSVRLEPPQDTIILAGQLARIINRVRPDIICIDVGGIGWAVHDILRDQGFGNILSPVNFGQKPLGTGPTGDKLYANRRAEMYDEMRHWFMGENGPVQIPDDDALQSDICGPEWGDGKTRYTSANVLQLEDKDKIKARIGASPDLGDAAALTFAVPFHHMAQTNNQPQQQRTKNRRTGY